jgi:hypothetical protein
MAAVSGISSTGGFSSVQGVGRSNSVRGPRLPDKATFEQDLTQSGLNADVSTDELLKSVQSSIKSAINDPSNNGKDFFEVIQSAVQKTLKENGVDTEKLTSLLQSQIPDQAGLGAYGVGSRPDHPDGASGVGPKGPPPAGGHRHGPRQADQNGTSNQDLLSVLDDLDQDNSTTQSTSKSGKTKVAQTASGSNSSLSAADTVASQFKRLISDLIKSLPSGTTLDLKA